MKQTTFSFAIIGLTLVTGQAFANAMDDALVSDENLGCTVKMCKMNPKGEMDEPKCRPAIEKYHREMAKKHPHPPVCKDGSEDNKVEIAAPASEYYDPCPAGTVAVKPGLVAVGAQDVSGLVFVKTITPSEMPVSGLAWPTTERACTGAPPVGYAKSSSGDLIEVYTSLVWMVPHAPRNLVDAQGNRP